MNDDPGRVDVLYAKCLDSSNRLQKIADYLVQTFVDCGLMERQYERVKIHATLMNTLFKMESDQGVRPTFNARPILEVTHFNSVAFAIPLKNFDALGRNSKTTTLAGIASTKSTCPSGIRRPKRTATTCRRHKSNSATNETYTVGDKYL